jgi:hypothetical protein
MRVDRRYLESKVKDLRSLTNKFNLTLDSVGNKYALAEIGETEEGNFVLSVLTAYMTGKEMYAYLSGVKFALKEFK